MRTIHTTTGNAYTLSFIQLGSGKYIIADEAEIIAIETRFTENDIIDIALSWIRRPRYFHSEAVEMAHFICEYFGEGKVAMVALEQL